MLDGAIFVTVTGPGDVSWQGRLPTVPREGERMILRDQSGKMHANGYVKSVTWNIIGTETNVAIAIGFRS